MCGITGKVFFDNERHVDVECIRRMNNAIVHRGPDGGGEYVSGAVGLGHRRLSIIDLDTGSQPMSNENDSVWVVYNGEVYNFRELRDDLVSRGHVFKSKTDTEVIVHLYEEYGVDCVARFKGMFAFALWDDRKKLLLLARDRVGIKPLYYANTGDAVVFGSEIKALLTDPSVKRSVNPNAIDRLLTYYYLPGEETLLQGVQKLLPGYYMTVTNGRVVQERYADVSCSAHRDWSSIEEAVEELRSLLSRTVKNHLISDVPVGVLLSGGVDSTGVLRYASEHSSRPLNSFTVGFAGATFADERSYARIAAERFGTIHQDITLTAQDFRDFLPGYVRHMEEPLCEPPAISLYYVSRLARESGVKVLLSGEGGDEAFAGYPKYRNLLIIERLKSLLGPAKGLLSAGLKGIQALTGKDTRQYQCCINSPVSEYYYGVSGSPATPFNQEKQSLYTSDFSAAVRGNVSNEPTREVFRSLNGESLLQQMLYVDCKSWLPDDLLVKADKMTMATSVELRVPLLDQDLIEFSSSLPTSFKIKGRSCKHILKLALEDCVPASILQRKKAGFPIPYDRWLKTEMRDFVNDTILAPNAALNAYFKKSQLESLLRRQQGIPGDANGNRAQHALDGSREVFSLLVLELWHKEFAV